MKYSPLFLIAILSLASISSTLSAATVIQPVGVTASSSYGDTPPIHMIDGFGFNPTDQALIANGQPVPVTWPSSLGGGGAFYTNWLSNNNPVNLTVNYDLGANVNVGGIYFWNYGGDDPGRSTKSFDVAFSADLVTWSTVESFANLNKESADYSAIPGQLLNLSQSYTGVRYVRLTNFTNYGSAFTGIEEIRFISAVPEPSTAILLTIGLMGALGIRRFRRLA